MHLMDSTVFCIQPNMFLTLKSINSKKNTYDLIEQNLANSIAKSFIYVPLNDQAMILN